MVKQKNINFMFNRDFECEYGVMVQVSPMVRRIVAKNPGPYTFKGTGTYIIGSGKVAVIDPGPNDKRHVDALMIALDGPSRPSLAAFHWDAPDFDGDGLSDRMEVALGTSPWVRDTDGDNIPDGLEVAHQTSPWNATDFPDHQVAPNQVGMFARTSGGELLISMVVYLEDGDLDSKTLTFEFLRGGSVAVADGTRLLGLGHMQSMNISGHDALLTFDIPVPQSFLVASGNLSLGATIGVAGSFSPDAKSTIDLDVSYSQGQMVPMYRRNPKVIPYLLLTASQGGSASLGSGDTVHQPLPAGGSGDMPSSWLPGMVCYQKLETIGVSSSGMTLIKEVVEAFCEDQWTSWCDMDCPGTVGQTVEVLDPGALLGG